MAAVLGFTGSREGLSAEQTSRVRAWVEKLVPGQVHHGDCVGADDAFHRLVHSWNLECAVHVHPPSDEKLRAHNAGDVVNPPRPFLERDRNIVNQSSFLIACPRTRETPRSGTWATIRYARKKGVPGVIIYSDGTEERFGQPEQQV